MNLTMTSCLQSIITIQNDPNKISSDFFDKNIDTLNQRYDLLLIKVIEAVNELIELPNNYLQSRNIEKTITPSFNEQLKEKVDSLREVYIFLKQQQNTLSDNIKDFTENIVPKVETLYLYKELYKHRFREGNAQTENSNNSNDNLITFTVQYKKKLDHRKATINASLEKIQKSFYI